MRNECDINYVYVCFLPERPDNSTTQMEEMFEDGNMAQSRTRKYRDTESTYWSSWKKHGSRSFLFVNREMTWTSAEVEQPDTVP